jgi:uncharacterized damage-inducible protein DinB
MKRFLNVCLALACLAGSASTAIAQGRGGAACTTVACDVAGSWERSKAQITGIANAMPEDKFGFKSTPAQRSFGEHVLHIAQVDLMLLGTLGAKTAPPTLNMKATSKAEILAQLKASMDYGSAVMAEFGTDALITERVKSLPFLGATTSRLNVIYFSLGHSQDTYGQMVVYLRLNGITPPASMRGGV